MRNLLPLFIQEKYLENNFEGCFEAVTLFVDISGFTVMTSRLMEVGDVGAEILSSLLNKIYTPILNVIDKRGGFISTFAGDGFTVIFPLNPPAAQATLTTYYSLYTAQKIKTVFQRLGQFETRFGRFELQAKIGVSSGTVEWGIVGDQEKMFFFRGNAIETCAQAEEQARSSDVVFDQTIFNLIPIDELEYVPFGKNYYRLHKTPFDADPIERRRTGSTKVAGEKRRRTKHIRKSVARRFFPDPVIDFRQAGEFRNAVSIFISFKGVSTKEELDQFISILIENGKHYSGYFNKMDFGDKGGVILFVFGAPIAFEDNVERAMSFILSVKRALAAMPRVKYRAGISYGTVYAGIIGGQKRCEYTIIGDIVNLSARMMMRANFGDIWLSERVYRYVKRNYEAESVGDITFKGKSSRIPIFNLIRMREAKYPQFEEEMIGRQSELRQLIKFSQPIFQGKFAGIAYIFGDAGMGKSLLAFSLQKILTQATIVKWFVCPTDQILSKPFSPLIHFLHEYFKQSSEDPVRENRIRFENIHRALVDAMLHSKAATTTLRDEIRQELIRIKSILGAFVGLHWAGSLYDQLDAKGKYENTLSALKTLILAESLCQPVVIQIEDGHWLDADSREFINVLCRNIANYPILIVTTMRYADDGRQPSYNIPNVKTEMIDLQYMSDEDLGILCQSQLGGSVDAGLIDVLKNKTQANPFYAQQFLHYFRENHLLENRGSIWYVKSSEFQVPDSINAILIARIDRLTQQVKEVVKAAAVIGREFEIRILSHVLKHDVIREVILAEKEQVWAVVAELQCIFKHGLLRDSAYQMQLESRRRELHRLTGEAIEVLDQDNLAEKYPDLALHFERAEYYEKAVEYLEKAGNQAKDSYKNLPAISFFQRLLNLLPLVGLSSHDMDCQKIAILRSMGDIYKLIGQLDTAKLKWNMALSIAEQLSDKASMSLLLGNLSDIFRFQGDYDRAFDHLSRKMELVLELDDPNEISRAYRGFGSVYMMQSKLDQALENFEKALEISQKNNDSDGISRICGEMARTYDLKGNYEKAISFNQQILAIEEQRSNLEIIARVFANLGVIHFKQQNYQQAQEFFKNGLRINEELGRKQGVSRLIGNLGAIYAEQGDFEHAMSSFERKLRLSEELGEQNEVAIATLNIGHIYKDMGDFDQAEVYFKQAMELLKTLKGKMHTALVMGEMGDISRQKKDFDKALQLYEESIQLAESIGVKYDQADFLNRKISLLCEMGRINEARRLISGSTAMAQATKNPNFIFQAKVLVERINYLEGHKDIAVSNLEKLLRATTVPNEQAEVHRLLWSMTGLTKHKMAALVAYQKMYNSVPKYEFKKHIDELLHS